MMDRVLLDEVTHVVVHGGGCPDGIASAILLADALGGVKLDFLAHGTPEYEKLEARPGMLFCDLTPPAARVQEFVNAGAIVLDHHAKQREIVEAFGARGVYADLATEPGVSGAALAFREVWQWRAPEGSTIWARAHAFAKLAGIRDTWQTRHPDWKAACEQAEALRFYPWSFFEKAAEPFHYTGQGHFQQLLAIGPVLVERTRLATERTVAEAFGRVTTRGTRLMIVGTTHTSDAAEAVGDQADLVVGFAYSCEVIDERGAKVALQLSMRSQGGYDVGALCKSLGGGGHHAAAGARVHVNSSDPNPYEAIWRLVEDFERGTSA
jgi:hypothetical protein